jgi:RNA polymerase sigma-70 factor (ECF subfamily)
MSRGNAEGALSESRRARKLATERNQSVRGGIATPSARINEFVKTNPIVPRLPDAAARCAFARRGAQRSPPRKPAKFRRSRASMLLPVAFAAPDADHRCGTSSARFRMSDTEPTAATPATSTRASIFLKLKSSDPAPRELAWRQFYERYAPVILGYAKRTGASAQQAEEVVQNLISGFFEASPRFVYDPSRGRFRGYLKACVGRALSRTRRESSRHATVPVDELDVPDARYGDGGDEELWEQLWRQQLLRRAIDIARQHYQRRGKLKTFEAFEQNVLLGVPAQQAAQKLGMNVASVHTAKLRVTEKLKEIRAILQDEEG